MREEGQVSWAPGDRGWAGESLDLSHTRTKGRRRQGLQPSPEDLTLSLSRGPQVAS